MDALFSVLRFISKIMNFIAGVTLTLMMLLTVADVSLRAAGHPIIGTYEVVALSLAVVIGFGIPKVSLDKGHVYMEFLLEKLGPRGKDMMNTFTRILVLILFFFIGYNLLNVGAEFHASGRFHLRLSYPFIPSHMGWRFAASLSVSCSSLTS